MDEVKVRIYNPATFFLMFVIGIVMIFGVSILGKIMHFIFFKMSGGLFSGSLILIPYVFFIIVSFILCKYIVSSILEEMKYNISPPLYVFQYEKSKNKMYLFAISFFSCLKVLGIFAVIFFLKKAGASLSVFYLLSSLLLGWYVFKTIVDVWVRLDDSFVNDCKK